MSETYTCPFCGDEHEEESVIEPGRLYTGLRLRICPGIPSEHVYFDKQFETGPGRLVRIKP